MSSDIQNPPNGLTIQDLADQTAEVKQSVTDIVQTVIDRVDEKTEQIRSAAVEQVEAVRTDSANQALQAETDHRISLLLEQIGTNEAAAKIEVDRKFNKYFMFLVVAFMFLLAIGAVNYFQILNPRAGQSVFELGAIEMLGASDLCPGDSLHFKVPALVEAAGVYRLAMATWRVDPPPAFYAFSDGLDMVIAEKRDFPIEILWLVPATFDNLATGRKEPWPPGAYSRDLSVTATGRNTSSEPRQIKFTIREDCPNRAISYHAPLYSNP